MSGHIFISYRHGRDGAYVDALAAHLERGGLRVWFDREIVAGDRWIGLIRERVDTCAALVVVMTPDAEQSEWVAREIERADELRKPILPLLLEGRPFFRLGDLQYEDVIGGRLPSATFTSRLLLYQSLLEPQSSPPLPEPSRLPTTRVRLPQTAVPPAGPDPPYRARTGVMRWRFLGLSAAIALIAAIVTVIALTRETDATQRHGSTPPVTTSTTTALTATSIAPETAQVVAIAFVTAWLRRGLTAAAWHSGVAAKSTPELAQALDGVDPKTVPARRITGAAVLVNGTTTSATVTVPVDTGLLTLELAQHNANWLVDAIDWTPN